MKRQEEVMVNKYTFESGASLNFSNSVIYRSVKYICTHAPAVSGPRFTVWVWVPNVFLNEPI